MPVDDLYVPNGVFLKCDQGAAITQLIVTPKKHKLYGLVIATETDNIPLVNIAPFGACSSSGNVCVPKATQWKNAHEGATRIEGQKPLLETSYCKCMQGGNINIFFDRDSALAALEGDKKSRVDKIPRLDNILGNALMGPSAVIYKLAGVDASDVGRGFRKGAKGTWNFLTHDMWQGETWEGMGNAIMTGIVGYMPPMSEYPSQAEIEIMQEWMNTTPEERLAGFDESMNTDLTTTHEAIKQAASDFWDKKIENGTAAESGVMIGEASEFVLELFIGGKGINNVIKAVKGTSAVANLSEKTAKAISMISQFVKTSKLAKFAKSIKGIFKVGRRIYNGLAKTEAYKYAENLLETLSKKKMPRAVAIIVDKKTGNMYRGVSGAIDDIGQLDKKVLDNLPSPSREKWPVENCAEVDAYNQAIKAGVDPKNMEMHTVKIDARTRRVTDYGRCENCKITTKDVGSVTSD